MNLSPTFFPEDFGAVADGETLCTAAIQAAIDACHQAGGGVVHFGRGVFRSGSIDLKSNVELHLGRGCKLVGSGDLSDYKSLISPGFKHEVANEGTALYLIGASHAQNIAITGPGEINARGMAFYDESAPLNSAGRFATKPKQRPRIVMLYKCMDVRFEDSRFVDSACWTFWLMLCERVRVHGITILGDSRLLNCDGIDFDACRDVMVSDCVIHSQDDCLVFRAIQKVHEEEAICENITVSNCILSSTHQCVRISCPNDHIVRNCVFTNLTMRGRNGILLDLPQRYYKPDNPSRTKVSGISFSNCHIDCRSRPLRIAVEEGVEGTSISGISLANMQIKGGKACVIQGNSSTVIESVSLSNVRIQIDGDDPLLCSGCRGLRLDAVELSGGRSPMAH